MSKRARTIMGGACRRTSRSGYVTEAGTIRWLDSTEEDESKPSMEWMPRHWREDLAFRQATSAMKALVMSMSMCTPGQDPNHLWQFLSFHMRCAPPLLVYALVLLQRALQGVHVGQYKDKHHQIFDRIFSQKGSHHMMRVVCFSVAMRLATKNEDDEHTWPADYVVRIAELCQHKMTTKSASDMELYLLQRMEWRSHVTLETYQHVVSMLYTYQPTAEWRQELADACSFHD